MVELQVVKKNRILSAPCLYTLKIELLPDKIKPVIWRRLDVDGRVSLGKLHHFIQAAFGWGDVHLHEFEIRGLHYGDHNQGDETYTKEIADERQGFLNRLLSENDVFTYFYDFVDEWDHVITVESVIDNVNPDPHGGAWLTEGARASPPENVGGPNAYHAFLETLLVDPHTEKAIELRDWVGGKFDPLRFDMRLANAAISRIMYNGWGGK